MRGARFPGLLHDPVTDSVTQPERLVWEILATWSNGAANDVISQWVNLLGDDEVVKRASMLEPAASDPETLMDAVNALLAEVDAYEERGP